MKMVILEEIPVPEDVISAGRSIKANVHMVIDANLNTSVEFVGTLDMECITVGKETMTGVGTGVQIQKIRLQR